VRLVEKDVFAIRKKYLRNYNNNNRNLSRYYNGNEEEQKQTQLLIESMDREEGVDEWEKEIVKSGVSELIIKQYGRKKQTVMKRTLQSEGKARESGRGSMSAREDPTVEGCEREEEGEGDGGEGEGVGESGVFSPARRGRRSVLSPTAHSSSHSSNAPPTSR
jgi:hypothetical protein